MAHEIGVDSRQERGEESATAQNLEAARSVTGEKELQRLIEEPRRGHRRKKLAQGPEGARGGGIDVESELRLEARGAQHPHWVLAVARLGIADETELARGNVLDAAHVVPNGKVGDVVVERVGGEIAPPDVLIDRAVDVVAQNPSARIEGAGRIVLRLVELGGLSVLGVGVRERLLPLPGSRGRTKGRDL